MIRIFIKVTVVLHLPNTFSTFSDVIIAALLVI